MTCPKCYAGMRTAKHGDVTVDFCELCYGVWLDKGELERIALQSTKVEGSAMEALQLALDTDSEIVEDKSYTCPHCEKIMQKVKFKTKENVIADKCPVCTGMWFDPGELIAVTDFIEGKQTSKKKSNDVSMLPSILAMFGIVTIFILILVGLINFFR